MNSFAGLFEPLIETNCSLFDTILFSYAGLHRNVKDCHFTHNASDLQNACLADLLAAKAESLGYIVTKLSGLDADVKTALVEKSFYKKHFVLNDSNYAVFSPKDSLCMVFNEEAHVSFRSVLPGLDLLGAWDRVNETDNAMAKQLDWAFDPDLGYLQADLALSGSGLYAGFMAHTPALIMSGLADSAFKRIIEAGFMVNGRYSAHGNTSLFDIALPPGSRDAEEDSIQKLEEIARLLHEYEKSSREQLMKRSQLDVLDSIGRALGRAICARLVSRDEATEIILGLRFGIVAGVLEGLSLGRISDIWQQLEIETHKAAKNSMPETGAEQRAAVPESCFRARVLAKELSALHFRKGL